LPANQSKPSGCSGSSTPRSDLRVNLEVDVGLHRGGFALAELEACLGAWPKEEAGLELSGLMGYDAHVGKVPWQSAGAAHRRAAEAYAECVRVTERAFPEKASKLCLNGSGSPTFQNLTGSECWNEVTIGSAFVKPTDFDIKTLEAFEPAAFIASPVLKVEPGFSLPGGARSSTLVPSVYPAFGQSLFVAGGTFDAEPVYPEGLKRSPVYGDSFNQAAYCAPKHVQAPVDSWIFLRPRQSESILLRHGPLVAIDGDDGPLELTRWPVLMG
jgi:D-serine deaminase-like pyridoxal phosphate-dependent protein